jgi:hypothetical protein
MPGVVTSIVFATIVAWALASTTYLFIAKQEKEVCQTPKPEPCNCDPGAAIIASVLIGVSIVVASVLVAQKRQAPETSPAPTYQAKTTLGKSVQSQTTFTSISGHANQRFHITPENYNTNQ